MNNKKTIVLLVLRNGLGLAVNADLRGVHAGACGHLVEVVSPGASAGQRAAGGRQLRPGRAMKKAPERRVTLWGWWWCQVVNRVRPAGNPAELPGIHQGGDGSTSHGAQGHCSRG